MTEISTMLTIDGSEGEGGGQILRTSLALALVTRTPVRVTHIRKRRSKPGLLRQHLAAVRAAAKVGAAEVSGAELLSTEVILRPSGIAAGEHRFPIGSAGSTTLVLQTVLPALLLAGAPSTLVLEGGTHNPHAPPFPHLARAFLPLLGRMGPHVAARLERAGFYPAGGGRLVVEVTPAPSLAPLDLLDRGAVRRVSGTATIANLPASIALREMEVARAVLGGEEDAYRPDVLRDVAGPGNVVAVTAESEHVTEVFTAFGERGVRAEVIGERAAHEAKAYLDAGVPVGEHLADQLLLPLALAGRGSFRTVTPSSHTTTQAALLRRILGVKIRIEQESELVYRVDVER
jgi:RNA 3'-terminal phosphate cyclase (ATP)